MLFLCIQLSSQERLGLAALKASHDRDQICLPPPSPPASLDVYHAVGFITPTARRFSQSPSFSHPRSRGFFDGRISVLKRTLFVFTRI